MKCSITQMNVAGLVLLLNVVSVSAGETIININARIHGPSSPLNLDLKAGTYHLTLIGKEDGGTFNSYSVWRNTTCKDPNGCTKKSPTEKTGWLNTYLVQSNHLVSASVDGKPVTLDDSPRSFKASNWLLYPNSLLALENAVSSVFTIDRDSRVGFSVSDHQYALGDNRGGLSLLINTIPSLDIYVDDNALNDPGPYDLTVSDPNEDGTNQHPFDMVQEGIDAAPEGWTVIVREGTYYETVRFNGKNINVTSFDPDLCGTHTYPVIDAGNSGTVVTFDRGEDPNCSLSGFVLTRGLGKPVSSWSIIAPEQPEPVIGAIACIGTSPRISNCLIVGNRCGNLAHIGADSFSGVIYCEDSNAVFENCTIADNYGGNYGASLYLADSNAVLSNSIVWGNLPEQIMVESGSDPIVVYSNIQGTWPGEGNIALDPSFAYSGYWADSKGPDLMPTTPGDPNALWVDGDYHLMSREGRWDPLSPAWINDEYTSLCIDAGDPVSPWECEPSPNGERINMGAYGNTLQASLTSIDCTLTISSTEGGSVAEPGEGMFPYGCNSVVPLVATSEQGYHFTGWSGTAVERGMVDNPESESTTVLVDADETLIANFVAEP